LLIAIYPIVRPEQTPAKHDKPKEMSANIQNKGDPTSIISLAPLEPTYFLKFEALIV